MIERSINTKQVKLSNANATDGLHITSAERARVCEYLRYSVDSIADVMATEERYGNRAPILQTLATYRNDAIALLARMGK